MSTAADLMKVTKRLNRSLATLSFGDPVTHTYNPLEYGWAAHEIFLKRYADTKKRVIFLGMNPGPFGMAQTAVPFGEVAAVRDWMKIETSIGKPKPEHPKRPVTGFECTRSEVSGRRLWGLFSERYPKADQFFKDHFVVNFCPLVFMEESGRNRTPDKLSKEERKVVYDLCDQYLAEVVSVLQPKWVIGVGGFALKRAKEVLADYPELELGCILHPSPASPAANRGWAEQASQQLEELGIWER
jgi:single-strand selective monofunctional uracil DNA glycosylase